MTAVRRIVADLHAADPQATAAFYRDFIGLDLAMDMGWIVTFVSPANATAQVTVMSHDATATEAPGLSIEVDDVEAMHRSAVDRGLEIVHPLTDEPWGVRRFFVRDPAGIVVNVMGHR